MVVRRLRSRMWLALAGVVAVAACALGAGSVASASSPNSANAHLKHVFVIMEENHSLGGVIGDPMAPTFTELAQTYAVAQNYYGVTHPSEPNYLALVGGSNFGLNADDASVRIDAPNLADQLEAHGYTWASYEESMPYAGFPGSQWPDATLKEGALYAAKHNPFSLFTDIRDNPTRMQNIKPFTSLATDLASNHVANFNLIVPNQCHDMHGGIYRPIGANDGTPCPYSDYPGDAYDESLKSKADAWLASTVSMIMHSKAWTGNSAIFIVADEADYNGDAATDGWADTSGCCDSPILPAGFVFPDAKPGAPTWGGGMYGGGRTPAIVITTNGPRGYTSTTPYNHYSLLTTIEDNWHLGHLGNAGDTAGGVLPMDDLLTH
jgi:hypothetical protein